MMGKTFRRNHGDNDSYDDYDDDYEKKKNVIKDRKGKRDQKYNERDKYVNERYDDEE